MCKSSFGGVNLWMVFPPHIITGIPKNLYIFVLCLRHIFRSEKYFLWVACGNTELYDPNDTCGPTAFELYLSFLSFSGGFTEDLNQTFFLLCLYTYFPEYKVWISSGRVASGPTAFSAKQNTACRFSLKPLE